MGWIYKQHDKTGQQWACYRPWLDIIHMSDITKFSDPSDSHRIQTSSAAASLPGPPAWCSSSTQYYWHLYSTIASSIQIRILKWCTNIYSSLIGNKLVIWHIFSEKPIPIPIVVSVRCSCSRYQYRFEIKNKLEISPGFGLIWNMMSLGMKWV